MNWIIKEAQNADPRKDRIILENPKSREELDNLLMEKFYPAIIQALKKTNLPYNPVNMKDTHIDSVWEGPGLGRKLLFFLYDHVQYPILRGDITVSKTGYMFERTFFLGLPKETEPDFLFRILSDPQFGGMPPTLEICESEVNLTLLQSNFNKVEARPEWNVYYDITLKAGSGYGFGPFSLYNTAIHLIEATIKDSVEMYELAMIDGFSSMEEVEAFLQVAYRCFEAC